MRDADYRAWLETHELASSSVSTKMSDARRVDQAHGDLDEHFANDRMASLLAKFAYSRADEEQGRAIPTALPIEGNLYNNLSGYRSAINTYRRFCEAYDNPQGRLSGLDRQIILDAIAACDEAGSVAAFVATLEDRGQPSKYWLLHDGTRYPSKAIVHWAMRERGIEASAGGSLCKATLEELGFIVIDWPELQHAREDFLRQMPGFSSFQETEGSYWEVERRYKNQLIEDAQAIASGNGDDRSVGEAIYRILVGGQQGVPLNWRTLPEIQKADVDLADRFYSSLGALARSEAPGDEAIASAAHDLEALRDAGIAGLRRGEVLSIPTTVWATLHPEEASWFKIAKIEEMGKRFFGRKLFPQNEFREADLAEWLQLMRALFGLLKSEFEWAPRDLFDVQGFVWVALGGNETANMDTSGAMDDRTIWLVTSLWGDSDGTDRFIDRGEWSLLTDTGSDNNRRVKEMQVGDRIFLKDYIPRAANLPFEANGGIVTAHRIRAAGTVVEASDDGLRVGVEWDADFEPRIWYFYTNNTAVWRLKDPSENHPSADRLRAFLIDGADQDYAWFLSQPFWRDRLFGAPTTETGTRMKPTNLVLYGPPGTGKTYRTAKEAVLLCDGEAEYGEDEAGRAALMARYDELVKARQIEFVTFHQNFSYEDFVEGLRPHTDDAGEGKAGFSLKPETGIFKNIADRAGRPVKSGSEEISLDDRRVFKMSLGQANIPQAAWVYEESIQDGYALFGFEDVDWSPEKFADRDAILHELQSRFPDENITVQHGKVKSPDRFRNQLSTGDVIVTSKGLNEFRAIGIVEGPYEYAPKSGGHYCHRRKVRWLWEDPDGVAVSELMPDRRFSLDTIYELPKAALNLSVLSRLINSGNDEEVEGGETLPHVLIIDEINRANISKVFGELITLIEPDKRLGMANALKVRLPYSKRDFGVPANLHIIGTMNTADRSIALLDTALRRRFRFEEIAPEPELLPQQVDGVPLRRVLEVMNERIEYLHDREHRIGHAFFMGDGGTDRKAIDATMRDKVIPLLQEYFFDDWSRIAAVVGEGFIEKRKLPVPPGIEAGEDRLSWSVRCEFAGDAYVTLIGKARQTLPQAAEQDQRS